MTDLLDTTMARNKRRSASMFVPNNASLKIPKVNVNGQKENGLGVPNEIRKQRKPASRSQSDRNTTSSGSFRKGTERTVQRNNSTNLERKPIYNSEPRIDLLDDERIPKLKVEQHKCPHNKKLVRSRTSINYRKSSAFLQVPGHNYSDTSDDQDEDSYRLRSFNLTSKGVVNRGDSFRSRKSRSSSYLPQDSTPETNNGISNSASYQSADIEILSYKVLLIGPDGVGKTALINQFMTTESINVYDTKKDAVEEKKISVMLNGEESEMTFINATKSSMNTWERIETADAFILLYSVIDKDSFLRAETELAHLQDADLLRTKPAILVANKIDLARSRAVSPQDGKCLACTYKIKFIEISVVINHNVDELLVGLLNQIRLKTQNAEYLIGARKMHAVNDCCPESVKSYGGLRIKVLTALGDNYMYIIVDEGSKEAAVVDPVEPEKVLKYVKDESLMLTKVLTTHHHWDHAGGNQKLINQLSEPIEVYGGDDRVEAVTKTVSHDDTIAIGGFTAKCIFTPCHTSGSICYYIDSKPSGVVFTGDTLFIGGCGRFFEGTASQMYEALVQKLGSLPKNTNVYCGHEYTCQNLQFALHVEPENGKIQQKLAWAKQLISLQKPTVPSTIAEEFETNPFMRVDETVVKEYSKIQDPVQVMDVIRDRKNKF